MELCGECMLYNVAIQNTKLVVIAMHIHAALLLYLPPYVTVYMPYTDHKINTAVLMRM